MCKILSPIGPSSIFDPRSHLHSLYLCINVYLCIFDCILINRTVIFVSYYLTAMTPSLSNHASNQLFGFGHNQFGQISIEMNKAVLCKPTNLITHGMDGNVFASIDSTVSCNGSILVIQGFCCGKSHMIVNIQLKSHKTIKCIVHYDDILMLLDEYGTFSIYSILQNKEKYKRNLQEKR